MAPRGRPRRPRASPAPQPARHPSQSPLKLPSEVDHMAPDGDNASSQSLLAFFNTTFSAHRVSPLHIGEDGLPPARLRGLAHRLRDVLVGDVVRGVEVGLEEGGAEGAGFAARAGALLDVAVGWISVGGLLRSPPVEEEERTSPKNGTRRRMRRSSDDWRTKKALHVGLRYKNAVCTALLLPPFDNRSAGGEQPGRGKDAVAAAFSVGDAHQAGSKRDTKEGPGQERFLSLPLLLLRMPAPLQTVVIGFLSTTFDCRISALRLGTHSIVRSWESWVRNARAPSSTRQNNTTAAATTTATATMAATIPLLTDKDVVFTLGFYVPPVLDVGKEKPVDLGVKSIDVFIPGDEVGRFADAGRALLSGRSHVRSDNKRKYEWEEDTRKRRKLAGGRLHEEGWEWRAASDEQDEQADQGERDKSHGSGDDRSRTKKTAEQPFTEALARYVDEHLALDLFHPGVRITKIACGGFVMSEKRLKVYAPPGGQDKEAPGDDGTVGSPQGQRGAAYALLRDLVDKARLGQNA